MRTIASYKRTLLLVAFLSLLLLSFAFIPASWMQRTSADRQAFAEVVIYFKSAYFQTESLMSVMKPASVAAKFSDLSRSRYLVQIGESELIVEDPRTKLTVVFKFYPDNTWRCTSFSPSTTADYCSSLSEF